MLSDTVAVVTGGASGIGREIALTFAQFGARLVVADVRERPRTGGRATHAEIRERTDSTATFVRCDVTDVGDLERAVAAGDEFGGVDVMVNNAAIATDEEFFELSESAYDRIMRVNARGVFFGSRIAAERMIGTGGGSIVNVSSIAGLRGTGNLVAYCASKGAVRLMTYALADRLGPEGIRINALHPGAIHTAMSSDIGVAGADRGDRYERNTPMNRPGTPGDVADAAVFLASDLSGFVTGTSIPVDGGRTYTY